MWRGWGEGPPTLPDSSGHPGLCLPPPLLPPFATSPFPPGLAPPVGTLPGAGAPCPSHGRPPAGALTIRSLLPSLGTGQEGCGRRSHSGFRGWSPAKPPSWVSNSSPRIWGQGAVSRQTYGPGSQGAGFRSHLMTHLERLHVSSLASHENYLRASPPPLWGTGQTKLRCQAVSNWLEPPAGGVRPVWLLTAPSRLFYHL